MAILKDLAQVLRVYEQGNTSCVVVALGRRLGQFRVYVKGGRRWPRKGFEGGFDLLTRGEILAYPRPGEALWVFKEWDERARPVLGQSAAMLAAASFLCELSEALTRQTAGALRDEFSGGNAGSSAALYDLLAASADALAEGAPPGPLMLAFTLRALRAEGLLAELEACAICGTNLARQERGAGKSETSAPVWLTAEGISCQGCVQRKPTAAGLRGTWLSPEAYRVLLHLSASARPVGASAAAAQQLSRALTVLAQGALEHDLRTLPAAAWLVASWRRGEGQLRRLTTV